MTSYEIHTLDHQKDQTDSCQTKINKIFKFNKEDALNTSQTTSKDHLNSL
jgi:hypothetical protein